MSRSVLAFHAVRTEGGLLPNDILQRIALEDRTLPGLTPEAYHLEGERLRDAVNRAWTRLTVAWRSFQAALAKVPEADPATVVTRDRWLLPLFNALGFGHLPKHAPFEVKGKTYAITHAWHASPIHLVGCRADIDTRDKKLGASPHGLVQDFLNRSDAHLWGFVSNGLTLRVLRDHHSLTQQAYVEFDLQAIFEGEAFSEFLLLWLVCHQSRVEAEKPEECWLEKWFATARDEGVRALDQLRAGVERAIAALGTGFLRHKGNRALHEALERGDLDKQDYYRQLLRLVYRLIFLFVAEDRGALLDPKAPEAARARYERWYATKRLRELAGKRRGGPQGDLWQQIRLVMSKLWDGSPELGLPALGSFLWRPSSTGMLNGLELGNEDLLAALRALSYVEQGKARHAVSFRNVGAEELGSVYESLLELHPEIHKEAARFELSTAAGHERKTTGSYYTPTALVDCLLDSALDPVLDEAAGKEDPEKAILDLKVCDPACGSGHFLVAAARRMAERLARVRSGGEEPSPPEVQRALRDVVGRCVFGVDLNPMAVELCKVSLWMEGVDPGRPLSFLEGHIQQGNALLGATPALMAKGIPEAAFEAIEGDDKKVVSALKKQNKKERSGQTTLDPLFARAAAPESTYVRLTRAAGAVEADKDDDIAAVRKKEEDWDLLVGSAEYTRETFLADAWCAAFVWPKQAGAMQAAAITQDLWLRMRKDVGAAPATTKKQVRELAREYSFFHWHLAFPMVFRVGGSDVDRATGWSGGFDAVMGNPPWERVKLQQQEFFVPRNETIAKAVNAAARKKLIAALPKTDPALWSDWCAASRDAEGQSHLVRQSGRYPLCGKGDVNTYALFAEHNMTSLGPRGHAGFIVPTGIATDEGTSGFLRDLVSGQALQEIRSYENEGTTFGGVNNRQSFCLLTVTKVPVAKSKLTFLVNQPLPPNAGPLSFELGPEDFALFNPNSGNCPTFRTRRDASINLAMYSRAGVLLREDNPSGNPWNICFLRMLDMANDSGLFRHRPELEVDGNKLDGNRFEGPSGVYLPLIEAKMVFGFDHRYGTYEGATQAHYNKGFLPHLSDDEHSDPSKLSLPDAWVHENEVDKVVRDRWPHRWLLGWRDICRRTDVRTVIASVIPRVAVGHKLPLMLPEAEPRLVAALYANLCSFALDYAARQKIGGTSLTYFIVKQLPVPPPATYAADTRWAPGIVLRDWLLPRVLELTYTAWDLEPFAKDCGYDGPPYRWDEARRFLLRCELDAAFFHLYGIARDDVDYIMETFPIVKRKDVAAHNTYRTKDTILDIYDRMARAIATGEPYQSLLDPPPADPRVAHPPRPTAPTDQA